MMTSVGRSAGTTASSSSQPSSVTDAATRLYSHAAPLASGDGDGICRSRRSATTDGMSTSIQRTRAGAATRARRSARLSSPQARCSTVAPSACAATNSAAQVSSSRARMTMTSLKPR